MSASRVVVVRRQLASQATLFIGGVLYLLLCWPSVTQRGYPPLDPIFWSFTFLWVVPLLISCWFDTWQFPSRRIHLWSYALGTALIDSATPVFMVPKSVGLIDVVIGTLFFFGPVHAALTFAIEATVQGVLSRWRNIHEDETAPVTTRWPAFSLLASFYLFTVVCIAIGFPFAFRNFVMTVRHHGARHRAENDWKAGKAFLYRDPLEQADDGYRIEYDVDPETGLRFRRPFITEASVRAYNQRISELLADNAAPPWRIRSVPSVKDLKALMTSDDLDEVTTFPFDVTPSIVVFRKGTVAQWGSTMTSNSNDLSIMTKAGGSYGTGPGMPPAYVGTVPGYPDLVVIREGNAWARVFTRAGQSVAWIER